MRLAPAVLLTIVLLPATALAQIRLLDEDQRLKSKQPNNISTDLMDPTGQTRLHLTTRTTSSDGEDVFSASSLSTFNLQAFLRLADGWSVNAAIPFGLFSPESGTNEFLVGNLRVGSAFGVEVRLQPSNRDVRSARFRIGAGLDIYLPTTSEPSAQDVFFREGIVRGLSALQPFEPELFIREAIFFRLRGHAQLSFDYLIIEGEVGLSPGVSVEGREDGLFLVAWAARVSLKPSYLLDPYVEAASSFQVSGQSDPSAAEFFAGRDYDTPVWVTTGVRLHFAQVDPAAFVSFNMDDFGVLFGIDLAGAAREYVRAQREEDMIESF